MPLPHRTGMGGMRTISYGGGVQSTAMIVLACTGRIPDVDAALFANVGDDSEHPASVAYVKDVMRPWAHARGLPVLELDRVRRDGSTETLYQRLTRPGSRSLPIPVRMNDTGAPGTRNCTADFKIKVIDRWLRQHGATKDDPAVTLIGISTDEIQRLNNKRDAPYSRPEYPLIDLGLSRQDCINVITDAGLPAPGKSSCYFCPFHRDSAWLDLHRDNPELFDKAADLETLLNERRRMLGKDPVWLTRHSMPLRDAINTDQMDLPLWADGCDSGHCFT